MKHQVVVPSAGESITEVYIGQWMKTNGELVKKDDVIVDLETQKANFEVQAEHSGKIEILFPESQTTVKVGDVIAYIDDDVKMDSTAEPATQKVKAPSPLPQTKSNGEHPNSNGSILSPAARKIAEEKEINPQTVKGTGKGGRITKEDILGQTQSPLSTRIEQSSSLTSSTSTTYQTPTVNDNHDTNRGEHRRPATRIRRQIAENLVKAQHTAAILTTFNEVDMSDVLEFRNKNKDHFKNRHGVKLGIMGFFALASVRALKEFPLVNATFTGEDIITHDYVDVSIAVSTERGLVVPVIEDVDKMSLVDFEKKLADISERARARKLSIPEMTGGTFTISNGGVFGSMLSTPILNMPQSGILGLHQTTERAVVVNGQIVIRPMMYLALSYDHRIIDGREAVSFLVHVKKSIENLSEWITEKDI